MEENALIEKLKSGDNEAFRYLVDTYKDRLYNVILAYLYKKDEAEDLLQDVFISVHGKINSFKGESGLYTWMCRIAINKTLDFVRYTQKNKRSGWFSRRSSIYTHDGAIIPIPDFNHPGVQMEDKELAATLFGAIDQLPERQKTAFLLFHVQGHSYKEIAEILETSLSSVESLIHRSKQGLRKKLKDYYENFDE